MAESEGLSRGDGCNLAALGLPISLPRCATNCCSGFTRISRSKSFLRRTSSACSFGRRILNSRPTSSMPRLAAMRRGISAAVMTRRRRFRAGCRGRWTSLKLKANDAQEKLAALQKQRGLIGVDETDNIVTDKLKELDEQLTDRRVGPDHKRGALSHFEIGQSRTARLGGSRTHAAGFALAAGAIARGLCASEHQIRRWLSETG